MTTDGFIGLMDFWMSCYRKMKQKASRGMEPWKTEKMQFLVFKLWEEMAELRDAIEDGGNDKEISDELLDVANMCSFIWLKLKEENRNDKNS